MGHERSAGNIAELQTAAGEKRRTDDGDPGKALKTSQMSCRDPDENCRRHDGKDFEPPADDRAHKDEDHRE